MKRILILIALICAPIVHAQEAHPIHGAGDPRQQSPIPSCVSNHLYIDDVAGTVYTASGYPCTWGPSGGGAVNLASGVVKGTGSGSTNTTASAADLSIAVTGTDSGSVNAYVVTLTPVPTSLTVGTTVQFLPNASNTATMPTLNVAGFGAASIVGRNGGTLVSGDISSSLLSTLKWDGTNWELQNPQTTPSASLPASTASSQLPLYAAGGTSTVTPSSTVPNMEFLNHNNADYGLVAFQAKLRAIQQGSTSTHLQITVLGDSILGGQGITTQSDMAINQVRQYLQAYGLGSNVSGVIPIGENAGLALTPFSWAITGSGWSSVTDFGPWQTGSGTAFNSMFTDTVNTDTATFSGECGTQLVIYGEETSTSKGWAVAVDGTGVGNALTATPGSNTFTFTTFTVAAGCHSVVLTPIGGGTSYLYGAKLQTFPSQWTINIDNLAHGNARTDAFSASPSTQMALLSVDVPDMTILELGANDIAGGTGTTLAQYVTNQTAIINYLLTLNPQMAILICVNHNTSQAAPVFTLAQAQAAMQGLAAQDGLAFVSFADSLGTLANATALGVMFSDTIHPNNNGGILEGSILAKKMVGAVAPSNYSALAGGLNGFATLASPFALSNNSFATGWNYTKSFTSPGFAAGTDYSQDSSGNQWVDFYVPTNSAYKGWRWCLYPANTNIYQPSQFTNCTEILAPTGTGALTTFPTTFTNVDGFFTPNFAGSPATNTFLGGFDWFKLATFSTGTALGEDASSHAWVYNFTSSGGANFGWQWCAYPGGTALATPSQLTKCHALSIPTLNDQVMTVVDGNITSATGGGGTGAVTCLTSSCTNISGSYSIAGGTFTAGNLLVLVWPTTTNTYRCWVAQNGGSVFFGLGHSVAGPTGMTITNAVTAAGVTVSFDYGCNPF